MKAYYSDGRGRYGTGESYDWFQKQEYDDDMDVHTSLDELWTYDLLGNGIELLRYNGSETNISIPEVVDGQHVVSLDSTFDGFYELKSVVIPKGVTEIIGAFYGCEELEKVVIPEGVINMTYAFNCCYSLKDIHIPLSARNFLWTFENTALENFVFPKGAENISNAFSGSQCLRSVYIPKSVTDTYEAFSDCEALTHVTLEEGIESIDKWAFYDCPSLLDLTIPKSVTQIAEMSVGFMEIREYTDAKKLGYKVKGNQIVPGFQIRGVSGSVAEQYAKENGIRFVAI